MEKENKDKPYTITFSVFAKDREEALEVAKKQLANGDIEPENIEIDPED